MKNTEIHKKIPGKGTFKNSCSPIGASAAKKQKIGAVFFNRESVYAVTSWSQHFLFPIPTPASVHPLCKHLVFLFHSFWCIKVLVTNIPAV